MIVNLKCDNQSEINGIIKKLMFLNEVKEVVGGIDKEMYIDFNGIYEQKSIRFIGFSRIDGSIIIMLKTDENMNVQDFFSRSFILDNKIINPKIRMVSVENHLPSFKI